MTYTSKHQLATTNSLNNVDGDQRRQEVLRAVAGRYQLGIVVLRKIDFLEQQRCLADLSASVWSNLIEKEPYVVGDQVNSAYLLEHLVDIGESHSVELAILGHLEETLVRAFRHFEDGEPDGFELVLDEWIITSLLVECLKDFQGVFFSALHDKPTWGFGQVEDGAKDDQGENDLERQREAPGYFILANPRHSCASRLEEGRFPCESFA